MKFRISDNLPDLSNQVSREEVQILVPIAASLSPAFRDAEGLAASSPDERVNDDESGALRSRQHARAG